MKSDAVRKELFYESNISDACWMIYDVPGNVEWIMYLICLVLCFVKRPAKKLKGTVRT